MRTVRCRKSGALHSETTSDAKIQPVAATESCARLAVRWSAPWIDLTDFARFGVSPGWLASAGFGGLVRH